MTKFVNLKTNMFFLASLLICITYASHAIPIEISSVSDFLKIGKDANYPLSAEYILKVDLDFTGSQTWNDDKGFEPIGTEEKPFTGKFDGNLHKIMGVYINRPSTDNVGIFGVIGKDGEVYNLAVDKSTIVGKDRVAVLVGYNKGSIQNCYVLGVGEGQNGIGLFSGQNEGTIKNSFAMGYIKGNTWVGGFTGRNEGGEISYCYFVGKLYGLTLYGGFTGVNNGGEINYCYWDREVAGITNSAGGISKTTAQMKKKDTYEEWDFTNIWDIKTNTNYPYIKTLGEVSFPTPPKKNISTIDELQKIGESLEYPWFGIYELTKDIDATSTKTWNNGKGFQPIIPFGGELNGEGKKISNLYINRKSEDYVGLIGRLVSGGKVSLLNLENCKIVGNWKVGSIVGQSDNGSIENCTVSGKTSDNTVIGNTYVGGIVGLISRGTVAVCSYTGTVEGYDTVGGVIGKNERASITVCDSTGLVKGDFVSGGLLGWNSNGTVSESYSIATLDKNGSEYVGGFVGLNDKKILNCYAKGNVTAYNFLGGFAGVNSGDINNCYSIGIVTATNSMSPIYAGGFCGYNDKGIIIYSYWDTEVSKQENSDGAQPCTTKEMKCSITYKDWDFNEIWYIKQGTEYPVLRWQGEFEGELEGIDNCEIEGEGITEGAEEGSSGNEGEGTIEGSTEGKKEGEGTKEGGVEGSTEGKKEGAGTTEGTTEGEGTKEAENAKCGCDLFKGKSFTNFWKYIFDFIIIGMLLSIMSGMYIKKK